MAVLGSASCITTAAFARYYHPPRAGLGLSALVMSGCHAQHNSPSVCLHWSARLIQICVVTRAVTVAELLFFIILQEDLELNY